jgi:hypothetical protein
MNQDRLSRLFVSQDAAIGLFRLGGLFLGLYLIAISQFAPFLYEKEMSHYRNKVEIEAITSKSLQESDCMDLPQNAKANCRVAQHEGTLLSIYTNVLNTFLEWMKILGLVAIGISSLIFCGYIASSPKERM